MLDISIVIVSYNVKYFLRQCLQSIYQSDFDGQFEIIVVDNNSLDDSVQMVEQEFEKVRVIKNDENLGFSKANNAGFSAANGKYILILNPDTLISEQTLKKCFDFCESNENIGALGVKMYDGSGQYLPESKRGFPTPLQSLYKISGISKLFNRSAYINGYYLGHLPEDQINEVDVLTGAFMFCNARILKTLGGFDEDYFMYGEDIELCYQIKNEGYKLVYFPESSIVHFKGESTKKSSLDFVKNFYGAMGIYAKKRHGSQGWAWNLILQLSIIFSGIAAILKSLLGKLLLPILDIGLLFVGLKGLMTLWAKVYFEDISYYEHINSWLIVIIASLVICLFYIFGLYDKKYRIKQHAYASLFAFFIGMTIYSLLPLEWRFSRLVLSMFLMLVPFLLYISRKIYNRIRYNNGSLDVHESLRVGIIGSNESFEKVKSIIELFSPKAKVYKGINLNTEDRRDEFKELENFTKSRNLNQIIFCTKDVSSEIIFSAMARLDNAITFKIANNENTSLLGSDSKNKLGAWYTLDIDFKISQDFHRRTKRGIDLLACFLFILLAPIILIFGHQSLLIYSNILKVLFGQKTWIGYISEDGQIKGLPLLRPSVFELDKYSQKNKLSSENDHDKNIYYARNYSIWLEMEYLLLNVFGKATFQ